MIIPAILLVIVLSMVSGLLYLVLMSKPSVKRRKKNKYKTVIKKRRLGSRKGQSQ